MTSRRKGVGTIDAIATEEEIDTLYCSGSLLKRCFNTCSYNHICVNCCENFCLYFTLCTVSKDLIILGPGRLSAGGLRMDRRAVTSWGVEKISRLASRLRRSARRGPHILPRECGPKQLLTAFQEGAVQNCY